MESKNEGNKNKIILEYFNCTMDKMDTLQQVTGRKKLNLLVKKMLELFLKILTFSIKKNLNTEEKTAKLIQKGSLKP